MDKPNKSKIDSFELKESKWTKAILFALGFFIILSLIHFIYVLIITKYFNLKDEGTLGDAIGGLTAPLINSITGLLVYFSFRQQLIANHVQITELKKQEERIEEEKKRSEYNATFDRITILISEVKIMMEEFTIYERIVNQDDGEVTTEEYKSWYALNIISDAIYETSRTKLPSRTIREKLFGIENINKDLKNILNTFKFILEQINEFPENSKLKNMLLIKFNNMFYLYESPLNNLRKSL